MSKDSAYNKLIEELRSDNDNIGVLLVGKAARIDTEDFYTLHDVDLVVIRAEDTEFERQF